MIKNSTNNTAEMQLSKETSQEELIACLTSNDRSYSSASELSAARLFLMKRSESGNLETRNLLQVVLNAIKKTPNGDALILETAKKEAQAIKNTSVQAAASLTQQGTLFHTKKTTETATGRPTPSAFQAQTH